MNNHIEITPALEHINPIGLAPPLPETLPPPTMILETISMAHPNHHNSRSILEEIALLVVEKVVHDIDKELEKAEKEQEKKRKGG